MIRFDIDYAEGAYEPILKRMLETNLEQTSGYGIDPHCENAKALIKKECKNQELDIHFLVGGTQTNTIVIASILRPYQGTLCADSGHINVHETGAIESTGHKVLALPSVNGKINANQVEQVCKEHLEDGDKEHVVQPGMVYISQPTEVGTLYSKKELEALREVCNKYDLPLFVDGARLGYGLMAEDNDVTLEDLSNLCDVFYIGGTKLGALFGEALVIANKAYAKDFRYYMKQRGGLLAKGRLLGIQFEVMFEDGAYYRLAKEADKLGMMIGKAMKDKGYGTLVESTTNQQFPILPNVEIERLKEKYIFSFWEKVDENHSAVRFCTSWATTKEQVLQLIQDLS